MPAGKRQRKRFVDDDGDDHSSDDQLTERERQRQLRDVNFISAGDDRMEVDGPGEPDEEARPSFSRFSNSTTTAAATSYSATSNIDNSRRQPPPLPQTSKDLGKWEKHTKGIGSKLLQKMGWTPGTGLGTSQAGIVKPVEVKLRPKGMGLAYRQYDESTEPTKIGSKQSDRQEEFGRSKEKKPAAFRKRDGWRKDEALVTSKRGANSGGSRVKYKTVDEIIAEGIATNSPTGSLIIKDMRGPAEQEIDLTSGTGLSSSPVEYEPSPYLQELRYNVRLLADRSLYMQDLAKSRSVCRSKIADLDRQIGMVQQRLQRAPLTIKRMDRILAVMRELGQRAATVNSDEGVDQVFPTKYQDIFQKLLGDLYEDFIEYSLSTAIVALLAPVIKRTFSRWNPLAEPRLGLTVFQRWHKLFQTPPESQEQLAINSTSSRPMTAYETMMYQYWLPSVRSTINNEWSPLTDGQDRLIQFIELWHPYLPEFFLENILHQLILPKLQRALDDWNPRSALPLNCATSSYQNTRQQLPLHTWLHPWLPVLGDHLAALFATIRHKLSLALTMWQVSEVAATAPEKVLIDQNQQFIQMISAWQSVWPQRDMDTFITRFVCSKLEQITRATFPLPPGDRPTDDSRQFLPLDLLMAWRKLLPISLLQPLLERQIFHPWLHSLYSWLRRSGDSAELYGDLSEWYQQWKQRFPPDIRDHPVVRQHFTIALNMLNQSMSSGSVEDFAGGAYASSQPPAQTTFPAPPPRPAVQQSMGAPARQVSFKETVEYFAGKHNILFAPSGKKHEESGKTIYLFGSVPVYLDGTVIYATVDRQIFTPVSFDRLLELQSKNASSQ